MQNLKRVFNDWVNYLFASNFPIVLIHCLVSEQTVLVQSGHCIISCLEQTSPDSIWLFTTSAIPLMNAGWVLGAEQRLIFSNFNFQTKNKLELSSASNQLISFNLVKSFDIKFFIKTVFLQRFTLTDLFGQVVTIFYVQFV